MFIKEIVNLDTQGKFIPAVQLSDYDNPQDNLGLVKSYIFANSTPDTFGLQTRAVGSIDLLNEMRLSFINGSANRFAVVANYGHGKSHLALVLANFFGKPFQSREVQEILKRIEIPLQNNLSQAENFRDLKQQHDQFLVIRLRGDIPRTLREQFFPTLKAALKEHPETENVVLPFWHQQAQQWLQTKVNDQQAKQFLNGLGTDIPSLLQDVDQNNHGAYEQYVQLFAHLNNGVMPNTESNFSLREAIIWTIDNFCGDEKPLAGVLVLFDEFSQFVENYSQSEAHGDLQDLLNGVGDRKGKSLFLAFSPLDPDEVAERMVSGQVLQNIKRELSRIDRKYSLYSLMESVLSASINTSDATWDDFLQDNPQSIRGLIYGQATELVWDLYQKRYDKELNWTIQKFRKVVTEGCFPLHPLTTALLCHLKMNQGLDDDARTILKFVREKVEFKLDQRAVENGKTNWILPIELPDYFGKRISTSQLYSAYENAIDNLEKTFGDDVAQSQYDVLKALLVQEADGINLTGGKQVALLAQMTGLDFEETLDILKVLGKNNITKYDDNLKSNSFWPVSINPQALEHKIQEMIGDKKFGDDELYALNDELTKIIPGADRIEVSVAWGTSSDWAANATIITKEKLTIEHLQELMQPYRLTFQGLQEGNRGLVGWLLALDEADIDYFKENAATVLNDAFTSETPPPVLLVLPSFPTKSVADQFLRYQALKSIGKDPDAVREVGQIAYDNEVEKAVKSLRKALGQLFGDVEKFASIGRHSKVLTVSKWYRANLTSLSTLSVQEILAKLYTLAYPNRPPEFFTDLGNPKKGRSPLRDAVKTVAKNLLYNRINTALDGMTTVPKDRLCKDQLMFKWHLLSTTFWIQEPDVLSLKRAWDYLEEQIKPDEQEVLAKEFIPNLLNSPFGFDFNTATLLFTAWIGKHNNELHFSAKGKVVGVDHIETALDENNLQDFLSKICVEEPLAIARRDSNKVLVEGRDLVDSIQKGEERSQDDAESIINSLNEVISSGICPENEKEEFTQAVNALETALEASKKYDQNAKKLLSAIAGENEVRKLLEAQNTLKGMNAPDLVTPTQPLTTEIKEKLDKQLKKAVEATCGTAKKLNRIESADAVRNALHEQKELLEKAGLMTYSSQIVDAESNLDQCISKLKAASEEAARKNQINAMTSNADLMKLYEYQDALQGFDAGSEGLLSLQKQKLGAIQSEISQLETFASVTIQTYQEVSQADARILYEGILSRLSKYSGTQHETALNQALEYLRQLSSFFGELQKSQNQPLYTPDDVKAIRSQINQICTQYSEKISTTHLAVMEKVQEDFEYRVQGKYEETARKIAELESEFSTAPSNQIRNKLSSITGFITPEIQARIDKLYCELNEKETQETIARLEKEAQDVIGRIETLFESIKDPKKRQECIERLQKNLTIAI